MRMTLDEITAKPTRGFRTIDEYECKLLVGEMSSEKSIHNANYKQKYLRFSFASTKHVKRFWLLLPISISRRSRRSYF